MNGGKMENPKRQSNIEEVMAELEVAVERNGCMVDRASEQLSKVLRADTPSVKAIGADKTACSDVPLAARIRSLCEGVRINTARFGDILDRCEL